MGGCKCTYRNCTAKSDGKIHMFHYPVFERLRCHQWLLNANRLDFLNLRLSQLKNRVVCQHHFKEDNFMNYKKDKLTFDAIPTEDGPNCDSSGWISKLEDSNKVCPIILEDIENDCCAVYDKKANFSVRYGDFLTNFVEAIEFDNTDGSKNITLSNKNKDLNLKPNHAVHKINDNILPKNEPIHQDSFPGGHKPLQSTHKSSSQPTLKVVPYIINKHMNKDTPKPIRIKKSAPKIRIISEKKIKEPIAITGTFTKVSPSITLPPPNKNVVEIIPIKEEEGNNDCPIPMNNISFDKSYVVQVEFEPTSVVSNDNDNKVINNCKNSKPTEKLQQIPNASPDIKIPQLKNKLTPERQAAINSKREFNKKMRNIIEACLDTKETVEVHVTEENKEPIRLKPKQQNLRHIGSSPCRKTVLRAPQNKLQPPTLIHSPIVQNVHPLSQQHKELSPKKAMSAKIQDSTIAYLEARIQKMESNLINRIDQNSREISELQATFSKSHLVKKDSSVQTYEHQKNYKKFLYHEISKFLSPNCNSTIYEELFINKYAIGEQNRTERNKRKRKS